MCPCEGSPRIFQSTQTGLPLKKGCGQTITHDYKCSGTTTLFAALDNLDGRVIGQCQQPPEL